MSQYRGWWWLFRLRELQARFRWRLKTLTETGRVGWLMACARVTGQFKRQHPDKRIGTKPILGSEWRRVWKGRLRWMQTLFARRLVAIRERLDQEAHEHRQQAKGPLDELEKRRQWQRQCAERQRKFEDAYADEIARCEGTLGLVFWLGVMRRLSGFTGKGNAPAAGEHEYTGILGGEPGFRSCGPAYWDNAVRTWDEDR